MGYDFRIGNAVPESSKEDGLLRARWIVEPKKLDHAPTFPNDWMTGNGNSRSPGYSAWGGFCRETGLYDLFFSKSDGLCSNHPGCELLNSSHLATIRGALDSWKAKATKPPGFADLPKFNPASGAVETPDEGKYDHQLARLIWLEWWVAWALENCETPAIQNT